MKTLYQEDELPKQTLEKLGLIRNGKFTLEDEDLAALLSGRRTDLITLKDLRSDDLHIAELDARLSLHKNDQGEVVLKTHPIYKEARKHPLLSDAEADKLISGKTSHLQKDMMEGGQKKKRIIEYDPATKEFVDYNPETVIAPDKVNGYQLSDKQKNQFRLGDIISLPDGTSLQHRASERKGLISDNTALVLSVMLDGGLSYLLIRSIKNLLNSSSKQKAGQSEAYKAAFNEMEKRGVVKFDNQMEQGIHHFQQSRGYGRNTTR